MVAALIAIPAFGQELTSDITGTVTNGAVTPVSGATVALLIPLQIQQLPEQLAPMDVITLVV